MNDGLRLGLVSAHQIRDEGTVAGTKPSAGYVLCMLRLVRFTQNSTSNEVFLASQINPDVLKT